MINVKRDPNYYRPWATGKGYIEKIVINQGWIDSIENEGLFFDELPFKRKIDFLAKSEKWDGSQCLTLFVYAKD